MPNTKRESEQWAKAVFEHCVALDLAANVTDDAAKPRAQKLQFPPGALCVCLRMNSPATSRVGNGGCPGPTPHTELKRPARKSHSISPASRTSGWRRLMISFNGGRNRSS